MLSINQVLQQGRYHITNRFEHEDTGVTYQAFDNVLKTNVIIKETTFDLKSSANPYKYPIAKQMENLIAIKHESFTQIHGFFSEVDHQYLVTEEIEGQSLKELIELNGRPFPLFTVLTWTEQLLDALNYLHSKIPPIIHRDIRPTNLTLTKDNKIKLLTYPIIREFNPKKGNRQAGNVGHHELPFLPLEVLWETLDYASQKVILNSYDEHSAEILESPIDERSDIYALGATIYYLITGRAPTDTLERSIDLLEGKEDPLVNPNKIYSQVPRNVSAFLLKALEIRRENRFESAAAMRQALQPMLDLMRKVEMEKQKAIEDPKVIKSALKEVEIARQVLKKQREEESRKTNDVSVEDSETQAGSGAPTNPPVRQNAEASSIVVPAPTPVSATVAAPPVDETAAGSSRLVAPAVPGTDAAKAETAKPVAPVAPATESFSELAADVEPVRRVDESDSDLFLATQMERQGSSRLIPVICIVVVLLVGGFLGYKFLGDKNSANNAQPAPEQKVQNPGPSPAAVEPDPSPSVNTVTENPAPSPAQTDEASTVPVGDEQKTDDSAAKGKKNSAPLDKKPTPAAAKTPVSKKKELTVDDLINDN